MIRALIIKGYGINCEREMALGCEMAGATSTTIHAKDFFSDLTLLDRFQLLMLPGGFSFGDELGAGKAFANRLMYVSNIKKRLQTFVQRGGCILGVCNGFQLLVKLGLLPNGNQQEISLTNNDSLRFENRWVHHSISISHCIFTKDLKHLYLPVRHGEGKIIFKNPDVHKLLVENKQVVFRYSNPNGEPTQSYPDNPNGSIDSIAGICDPSGRVLGMMAHPEAYLRCQLHPRWTRQKDQAMRKNSSLSNEGDGLKLFINAVNYAKATL